MTRSSEFWDALAPHHATIENSYLDLPSLRRILHLIHQPVLVVGAGQGLIVAELRQRGVQCDGVDLSPEMIKYARMRRKLDLIQADARAMPFEKSAYRTIICATGVVDFMSDEEGIRVILNEVRRIADPSGSILVAFYRLSAATEDLMLRRGLIENHVLRFRETLEIYRLNPVRALAWVAKRGKLSYARAVLVSLRSWAFSTWQEKRNALHMQKLFAKADRAAALIQAAPEKQPYRNEAEIRRLFARLGIPIQQLNTFGNCFIVKI